MKKRYLYNGIVSLITSIIFCISAIFLNTNITSLLWGFCGAGIIGGSVLIWKYFYWCRPENKGMYEEFLEKEEINLKDERKERFRDKSGRYAYIAGLIVITLSIVVFYILKLYGITVGGNFIIIFLYIYLVFQYVIGIIIFNYLNKKY